MTYEYLTDDQRQMLVVLVTKAVVRLKFNADPAMHDTIDMLEAILRQLQGTDTRIGVEKGVR